MSNPDDSQIKKVLENNKRIAVIGLSSVPSRPSYEVTEYMIEHGYEIFGVRPGSEKEVLGRPSFQSLAELREPVDIINVFRNPDAIPQVVDELLEWMRTKPADRRPKVLWLQLGISHAAAEEKARKAGLIVISDACILMEHRRLLG